MEYNTVLICPFAEKNSYFTIVPASQGGSAYPERLSWSVVEVYSRVREHLQLEIHRLQSRDGNGPWRVRKEWVKLFSVLIDTDS